MARRSTADIRDLAFEALGMARREGLDADAVRRRVDLDRATLFRHTPGAWRLRNGRYWPTPHDRIPRDMQVMTAWGPERVVLRDSRVASLLSDQATAIRRYRDHGDESLLRVLGDTTIIVDGRRFRLRLDTDDLDRLIEGSELHYDLYTR